VKCPSRFQQGSVDCSAQPYAGHATSMPFGASRPGTCDYDWPKLGR
jgi:hypothetical protein